jgi:archaellum component FlaC
MSDEALPKVMQNPDLGASYQEVYDALGRAYWEASDISSKDLIHGVQEEIAEILTAIDEKDLEDATTLFAKLGPKINAVNKALEEVKEKISQITKNIATASKVISAVTKVLSLWPV